MKMISKEVINGKKVITTETKKLFRKKIHKFEAQREYLYGIWDWLELPGRTLVSEYITVQLNTWDKL